MAADFVDSRAAYFGGSLGQAWVVQANAAVSQATVQLTEGSYSVAANGHCYLGLVFAGGAVAASNALRLAANVTPFQFSIGRDDPPCVSVLAESGTAGAWIVRRP